MLERMLENGFSLGGEQSGHMIFFWSTPPPVTDSLRRSSF